MSNTEFGTFMAVLGVPMFGGALYFWHRKNRSIVDTTVFIAAGIWQFWLGIKNIFELQISYLLSFTILVFVAVLINRFLKSKDN